LEEWLELPTEEAIYQIPQADEPEGGARNTSFIIADDTVRLRSRVKQLLGKSAWAENPHSRTRRILTNLHTLVYDSETILVTANFAVHRTRYESVDTYIGRIEHKLVRIGQDLRIREHRVIPDNEAVRPHGKISFILKQVERHFSSDDPIILAGPPCF
jgi:p-cumate 2,3-dioxygenase beta subunit